MRVIFVTRLENVRAAGRDGQLEWRYLFVTGGSSCGLGHLGRLVEEGSLGEEGHALREGEEGAGAGAGECGGVGGKEGLGPWRALGQEGKGAGAGKLLAQLLELTEH